MRPHGAAAVTRARQVLRRVPCSTSTTNCWETRRRWTSVSFAASAPAYTVYMPRIGRESAVLTIRITPSLSRRLDREARRQRLTRSEAARAILETALEGRPDDDLQAEARRQSELAARSASEAESLEFIAAVADTRGWK